jgi:glycosyltransferase involved in cell wall biosynthesis
VTPGDVPDFPGNVSGIEFIQIEGSDSLLSRLWIIPRAILTVLRIRPRVCHFHDYELIFALPFLRLLSRCRIIYDVHEFYPEMALESNKIPHLIRPLVARMVDMSEKILSRLADCIITATEDISKRFYGSHPRVTTIFNYPRLSLFVPSETMLSQIQKRYQGKTPIIYQGSMSMDRGIFQMINAIKIIKTELPDILLLLVGPIDMQLLQRANRTIAENGLEENIEIIGAVSHIEVINYMFASKIGLVPLLPTRKFLQSIPIKQFEYMACGIPVLGANLPMIASYINAYKCGKLFDSTSVEALAKGVMDMLRDEAEWQRMSEAGKTATRERWNWDRMEEKLFQVYEGLLN